MTESPAPATTDPVRPVFRERAFVWLWSGQTISQFGEQFSGLAIPVLAVLVLHAEAFQLGLLNAASTLAFLLVSLPAGAWIDRMLKRRVMIVADLGRAVMLAVIPLLWWLGVLQLWHLIVVAVIVGIGSVFFDVSYQSYIPFIVESRQVPDANSKLEASFQVARIGGPALAGALLAVLAAPIVLLADAISYLVSALALSRIRDREIVSDPSERLGLGHEIAEGVRFVAGQPLIRRVVGSTAFSNFFGVMSMTLLPLLLLKTLNLGTGTLGIIYSVGAVGGLLGALATPHLARKLGQGRIIPLSAVASGLLVALIPLAALLPRAAIPILIVAEFGQSFMVLVYNITQVSLRQRLCPPRLLGRMNASIRCVVWGVIPIGSLLTGVLGSSIGVVPTMFIGAGGALAGSAFVVFSPLMGMRELPTEQFADQR
jgi:MFS family permease